MECRLRPSGRCPCGTLPCIKTQGSPTMLRPSCTILKAAGTQDSGVLPGWLELSKAVPLQEQGHTACFCVTTQERIDFKLFLFAACLIDTFLPSFLSFSHVSHLNERKIVVIVRAQGKKIHMLKSKEILSERKDYYWMQRELSVLDRLRNAAP